MKTTQSKNEFVENFLKERESEAKALFSKEPANKGKMFTFSTTVEGKKLLVQHALSMYSLYLGAANLPVTVTPEPVVRSNDAEYSLYHYIKNRVPNSVLLAVLANTDVPLDIDAGFTDSFVESLGKFIERVALEKDYGLHDRKKTQFFNEALVNYAKFFANLGTENQFFEAVILNLTYKFKSPLSPAHTPTALFDYYYRTLDKNRDKLQDY